MLTSALRWAHCGSEHLVSNGHAPNGKRRFQCRDCKKYGRPNPGSAAYDEAANYDEAAKAMILAAYQKRASIRELRRIFGVCRNTVTAWLKRSREACAPGSEPGSA